MNDAVFEIACPACGERLSFPAQDSAARLTCPECKVRFTASQVIGDEAGRVRRTPILLLVALVLLAGAAFAAFLYANAELRSARRNSAHEIAEASDKAQRLADALAQKEHELQEQRERSDRERQNSRAEIDRLAKDSAAGKEQTGSALATAISERDESRKRHAEVAGAYESARTALSNAENQVSLLKQRCDLLSNERIRLEDALRVSGSSRSPEEQKTLAADIRELAELARVNQAFRESMLDKTVWILAGECDVLVRLSRSESTAAAVAAGLLAFERGQVIVAELHQQAIRLATALGNSEFRTDSARNVVARFNGALEKAQALRRRTGTDVLSLRNPEEQGAAFSALIAPFRDIDLGALSERVLDSLRSDSGSRK